MPLVSISLQAGKPEPYRTAISNEVYQAMRQTLDIPDGDRFQSVKSLLASAEDRTSFVVDLADCVLYGFL